MRATGHSSAFIYNDTPPTGIYTLSLHDALPISCGDRRLRRRVSHHWWRGGGREDGGPHEGSSGSDRKSTRLNSSHVAISYAVFCLKKKKTSITLNDTSPKL